MVVGITSFEHLQQRFGYRCSGVRACVVVNKRGSQVYDISDEKSYVGRNLNHRPRNRNAWQICDLILINPRFTKIRSSMFVADIRAVPIEFLMASASVSEAISV